LFIFALENLESNH